MLNEKVEKNGFVIGYDRRFLSDKAARWFAEVMAANGVPVSFVNKYVPTPVVMFKAKEMDADYSACITASHNPADYNGIKVFIKGGRDADEVITQKIEAQIANLTAADVKLCDYEEAIHDGVITEINR
ncbi:GlcNAc phosphomutase [Photobacterium aphoticum]|uniref:GlcNAc phosphomutase n=1 Tax=Photobacterium aphoticum TaxID=754436 RepID=A0A090QRR9_9GAMM|nr:GlcNAc phosphomutase [Photobacterium aphoticum]